MICVILNGAQMVSYEKLYNESWELFKKEIVVDGFNSILGGELIKTFLDQGYYLLVFHANKNRLEMRFDNKDGGRIKIDLTSPAITLADMYSFGKICQLTVWVGVQKDVKKFFSGELKEALSEVKGKPEPGVYMVKQDGLTYFIGTTVYFNAKELIDIETLSIDPKPLFSMITAVNEQITTVVGVE